MKITAIIMAFYMFLGSFIPKTDFSQMMHLSDLMEHYQEHKKRAELANQEFCFIEFIQLHILASEEHEDHSEHTEAPCQSFHSSVVLSFSSVDFSFIEMLWKQSSTEVSYQNNLYLSGFLRRLIHPPSFLF